MATELIKKKKIVANFANCKNMDGPKSNAESMNIKVHKNRVSMYSYRRRMKEYFNIFFMLPNNNSSYARWYHPHTILFNNFLQIGFVGVLYNGNKLGYFVRICVSINILID